MPATTPPGRLARWRPEPFRPPLWARDPHVQTVAGKVLRGVPRLELRRERWVTPDDDDLDLDFAPESAPGAPLVVVLHGLEGSARGGYAMLLYRELAERGLQAVGLNFRGCAGEPNRQARAYHSGETGDVGFVVSTLRERFPDRPLAAVGYSLGGNVLLKYLGEEGDAAAARLRAAAAVSVPYDLEAGSRLLERTFMGRIYSQRFLDSLVEKIEGRRETLSGHVDVDRVARSRSIREFDHLLTAPLHGFRSAEHYYATSSSARYLDGVRVPTLLLHAFDDPFLPRASVPVAEADAHPFLHPRFTEHGGHVGFVEGTPWAPRFWSERTVADFLAVALDVTPPPRSRLDRRAAMR